MKKIFKTRKVSLFLLMIVGGIQCKDLTNPMGLLNLNIESHLDLFIVEGGQLPILYDV